MQPLTMILEDCRVQNISKTVTEFQQNMVWKYTENGIGIKREKKKNRNTHTNALAHNQNHYFARCCIWQTIDSNSTLTQYILMNRYCCWTCELKHSANFIVKMTNEVLKIFDLLHVKDVNIIWILDNNGIEFQRQLQFNVHKFKCKQIER